jgi:5-methylthioadenosine/S-adenosylhomocysteine deaminase
VTLVNDRTLLRNGIVIPMDGTRRVHDPGSVLIQGDTIVAVGPVEQLDAHPLAAGAAVVDATGHAVIPGLHNAHMHSGLLRGTAESMAVMDWLASYVDPAHKVLTPEIARAASRLAYTESVRFGTTSVMDMWRFLDGSAQAADEVGLRATLVPYVADLPGFDYFETIDSTLELLRSHREASDGRVRSWVGLEHIFYCSPEAFRAAAALADEYDTGLHTHANESRWEVEESLRQFDRRPVEQFHDYGILGERSVLAHCCWLDDHEIDLIASSGTSVVHCPTSNMKLSSGVARVADLRRAGVAVGLGSDGEKENNNLDLFEEMKFASLLEKVSTLDPTTGDPWDVLAMATREGARALGLDTITGSLEAGRRADVVTVDLRRPHFVPVMHGEHFNVVAHLVFTASGHDVDQVWVDGRLLVDAGEVLNVDVDEVMATAQAAAEELFERRSHVVAAPSLVLAP